jgi:HTH-type transcriptional regulator/antitoxin HigA
MAPKATVYPYRPDYAVCPGETIQEQLDARGWTQRDLGDRMNRPYEQVNRLIKGKLRLTVETAVQLGRVLGPSPQFWLILDMYWQLDRYHRRCAILRVEP